MSSENIQNMKNLINKQFKKPVVQTFDESDDLTIERYSSGIMSLDLILGKGSNGYGFPVGRFSEIVGPEGAGKSSVVLSTIAEMQKNGKDVCLIDSEYAFNPAYAKTFGVNVDELLLCNPSSAEEGYSVAITVACSGKFGLVVVDSIASMVPLAEIEGDMTDQQMGVAARVNQKFIHKITPELHKTNTSLLAVNQLRNKIGGYGNPEVVSGGKALAYQTSVILEVRRGDYVKNDGNDVGQIVRFCTKRNKTAAPLKTADARLNWGNGFDKGYCLFNKAEYLGIIEKHGAWYYVLDKKWQGKDSLIEEINTNEELSNFISSKILGN
jgi:recombination protein RecA